jgi:hypothetical protein
MLASKELVFIAYSCSLKFAVLKMQGEEENPAFPSLHDELMSLDDFPDPSNQLKRSGNFFHTSCVRAN